MPVGIVLQLFRLFRLTEPSNVRGEAFRCVRQVSIRRFGDGMLCSV